jgi:O-antigen ligase/tetratricopeptide (TPR) repeat protein
MVVLSPWAFGAVHPLSLFVLYCGLSAVLVLWAALLVAERRFAAGPCPVALCMAGMVLLGVWQLAPLSERALATVSPATAALRADLFPSESEALSGDPSQPRPPATISLDPGVTRGQVVKLLAVLALFAAVRYAVANPAALRRLAVVCVVNGVALSVFALAQRFTAPPDTLYWHFASQGRVYGPFVCRNHFPFFVNVCVGLGLGLLLGYRCTRPAGRSGLAEVLADLGRNPAVLWLTAALGLMLAANLYSLSRGAVLALVGATAACGLLAVGSGRRSGGLSAVALAAVLGVALVGWLGMGVVGKRLDTLVGGDPLAESRGPVWERVLPLAGRFPVWGTGYGTFESVEPQQRRPGADNTLSWDHAHNDYLETLVEGGGCQLLLALLAIGLTYRSGIRAYRRLADRAAAALVLGGLFGFTTVVVHGFGDFGLHMPAIVVLTTVLAAQLVAAGDRTDAPAGHGRRTWLVFPTALVCLLVAVVLPSDGWRRERAERLRLAATRAEARLPAGEQDVVIRYLAAAVEFTPDDAALRLRLAEVRYAEYQVRRGTGESDDVHLRPALRDYLRVRAANPLLSRPYVRLAGAREHLRHPDAAANYLDRACRLEPTDAGLWHLAGLQHLADGEHDRAWVCWRHSLECSPAHLAAIVPAAYERLGAAGLADRVLPPDPNLLVGAARIPPLADRAAERQVVLGRALELLGDAPTGPPERLHLRAWLLREVGRPADAVPAYERAVERAPDRADWRFELADLLFERGDTAGATEQVRRVLRDRPDHTEARDLNARLVRARAGGQ